MKTYEATVRCSGSMHRIVVCDNGAISLPDHDRNDEASREALALLGGQPCRCLVVRRQLIGYISQNIRSSAGKIPTALRPVAETLRRNFYGRRALGTGYCNANPPEGPNLLHRLRLHRIDKLKNAATDIGDALHEAMHPIPYREGQSRWVSCDTKLEVGISLPDPEDPSRFLFCLCRHYQPRVVGESEKVWHKKHTWSGQRLLLEVTTDYASGMQALQVCSCTMYMKGLNYPVVAIDQREGNDWIATTGKQARGLSVVTARALVEVHEHGEFCTFKRWLR